MRIIETCPECGGDLVNMILTTFPPKLLKRCTNCGWEWQSDPEDDDVVRIPFRPTKRVETKYVPVMTNDYVPECCRGCSNHPANGGRGICCCSLPYVTTTAPKGKTVTWTGSTTIGGRKNV